MNSGAARKHGGHVSPLHFPDKMGTSSLVRAPSSSKRANKKMTVFVFAKPTEQTFMKDTDGTKSYSYITTGSKLA